MQKINSSYNPLLNALSTISNFYEIDQSIPLHDWVKTSGHKVENSQFLLVHAEFHDQNLGHWRFFRFVSPKSYLEIHTF